MPDRDVSDATPLEEAAIDVHHRAASLMDELTLLERRVDLVTKERKRIAAILKAFRDAPISMSSLQPLLTLADELNGPMKLTHTPTISCNCADCVEWYRSTR